MPQDHRIMVLPEIRANMIKHQGFRPQDLASYSLKSSEWKKRVLMEMKNLAGNGGLHHKFVDFVDSL